jgi:hypothetical protein
MSQNVSVRRRALLRAVAGVVLASTASSSFGQPATPEPGKAEGEAGKVIDTEKAGKGAAKKGKGAVLTVVVTGNNKLIAQAEVKVKFPPSVGGEATLPTDEAGEATFNSGGTGTAKVRVIVTGWESTLQDVILKEGPQRLTINLNPLPNAK